MTATTAAPADGDVARAHRIKRTSIAMVMLYSAVWLVATIDLAITGGDAFGDVLVSLFALLLPTLGMAWLGSRLPLAAGGLLLIPWAIPFGLILFGYVVEFPWEWWRDTLLLSWLVVVPLAMAVVSSLLLCALGWNDAQSCATTGRPR